MNQRCGEIYVSVLCECPNEWGEASAIVVKP